MTEALASVEGIRHSPRCDRERIENRRGGNIAHFRSCRARGITSVIHARTTRSNGMTRIEAVRRHLARMITVTRCPVARYIPRISRAPVYRSSFSALLFRLSSVACMQRAFQKSKRIATVKYLSLVRFRLKRREDLVVGKRAPTLSLLLFFFFPTRLQRAKVLRILHGSFGPTSRFSLRVFVYGLDRKRVYRGNVRIFKDDTRHVLTSSGTITGWKYVDRGEKDAVNRATTAAVTGSHS